MYIEFFELCSSFVNHCSYYLQVNDLETSVNNSTQSTGMQYGLKGTVAPSVMDNNQHEHTDKWTNDEHVLQPTCYILTCSDRVYNTVWLKNLVGASYYRVLLPTNTMSKVRVLKLSPWYAITLYTGTSITINLHDECVVELMFTGVKFIEESSHILEWWWITNSDFLTSSSN